MNPETSHSVILAAICLPLLGAAGVQVLGRFASDNARDAWTVVIGLATFSQVLWLIEPVMSGARPSLDLPDWMPGLGLGFEVEPLGLLFGLVASGLWILTSLYGFGYMRGHDEKNQTRFFTCFALAISAAIGIAFAGDLVTLFLFYEILTFSTFPLVTHAGTEAAVKAGRLYLGILVSTSVMFLLLAILWTANLSDDLGFQPGGILEGRIEGREATLLLLLFSYGVSSKTGHGLADLRRGLAALMQDQRLFPHVGMKVPLSYAMLERLAQEGREQADPGQDGPCIEFMWSAFCEVMHVFPNLEVVKCQPEHADAALNNAGKLVGKLEW